MANAIKKISVQRGYDVTQYVLVTFGGAGGQHACAVADALGITRVLIHPLAGVLSAYGMGLADVTAMRETAVEAPLTVQLLPELDRVALSLEADALAELAQQGIGPGRTRAARRAHLRYDGTDTALPVPLGTAAEMVASFEQAYRQQLLVPDAGQDDPGGGGVGRAGRRTGPPHRPHRPHRPRGPPSCRTKRRRTSPHARRSPPRGRPWRCTRRAHGRTCRSSAGGTCGRASGCRARP